MLAWMKQYKRSSLLAIACGIVTALLGLWAFSGMGAGIAAISATMIINTFLHFESYIATLKLEGWKNSSVLSMAIAETFLLVLFGACLPHGDAVWREFCILFAVYLVFNGASMMVIPAGFARGCGAVAALLGALLFLLFDDAGVVLVAVNLIVNGAERVVMSVLKGKKAAVKTERKDTDG